jgi:hypothetical protein
VSSFLAKPPVFGKTTAKYLQEENSFKKLLLRIPEAILKIIYRKNPLLVSWVGNFLNANNFFLECVIL